MARFRSIRLAAACIGAACSLSAVHAQCTQPNANGQAYNPTGADLGGASSQNDPASFSSADNVTVAQAGSISSVCFWGRYNSAVIPAVGDEQFQITFFNDAGGFPGTAIGGPYQLTAATTSLTRQVVTNAASSFVWTSNIPTPLAVTAGQCVWMEIVGNTPNTNINDRWRWSVLNNAAATPFEDGHAVQKSNANASYTINNRLALDYGWAINLPVAAAGCQIPPAANSLCSGATTVTIGQTVTGGDTTRGQLVPTPPCKGTSVSGPGLWYAVVGNGTTLSASTCSGGTNFDTVIGVYCGQCSGTNNLSLNCVASNDTGDACTGGAGADPSLVSWPATAGVTYYINVYGFEQAVGTFDLMVSSDNTAVTSGPCASDFCPVDLTGIPPANFEPDACGAETNGTDCDQAGNPGIRTIMIGQTYSGTVQTDGPIRDRDFWELGNAQPDTWYQLTAQSEIPTVIFTFNGACVPGSSLGTTDIAQAFTYCDQFSDVWQTDSTGAGRVMITTNRFYGLPCSLNRNHYKFTVTAAVVGACCQPATSCQAVPRIVCDQVPGSIFTVGLACSPTDPCSGACCTGTTCVISGATDCTAAGSTYQPGIAACAPTTCAATGVCCRGATCATGVTQSACTTTGAAGAAFVNGSTCNSGAVSNTPCCYANYNKVNGVSVQDIFDFLGDWFAGSPYARTGGDGTPGALSVQNIFDFLTNWFNGGCQ